MIGAESHVETSVEKNFSLITWILRKFADIEQKLYG
jgi:hypothetical protein